MRLDEAMPQWHYRVHHELAFDAPRAHVMQAVEEVTWAEIPLFRRLLFIASAGRVLGVQHQSFIDHMLARGFHVLDRTDEEIVVGAVSDTEAFRGSGTELLGSFRDLVIPGLTKAAFNIRYRDGILSTETRVVGADEAARQRFGWYWMVVRLPGGLIRRQCLRAVRDRVERRA